MRQRPTCVIRRSSEWNICFYISCISLLGLNKISRLDSKKKKTWSMFIYNRSKQTDYLTKTTVMWIFWFEDFDSVFIISFKASMSSWRIRCSPAASPFRIIYDGFCLLDYIQGFFFWLISGIFLTRGLLLF